MEAEGVEPKKSFRYHHCFNGDLKARGPMLIIEVLFDVNGPNSGAFIAHKWSGDGNATAKEINMLKRHLKKREFNLIHDYLNVVMPT